MSTTQTGFSEASMNGPQSANRLLHETSPYLLQHAHNPVDWYPWGDEAFERARTTDRPVFLSIGYSACHWCHVMERESFEDEAIAAVMNRHFVNVKVDREERPDVDEIYMNAVQMMTGGGGWPMSVFLTPDGTPFYGGTYFPPDSRYGRPGFADVLRSVATHYRDNRGKVGEAAERLMAGLKRLTELRNPDGALTEALFSEGFSQIARNFDWENGGFGSQPKFPSTMNLSVFLREFEKSGNRNALDMALLTLRKMARGGIYDHLGGGFHRYSVDHRWLVPHFEKMLYDNALLTVLYLEAFQHTGEPLFRQIVTETLSYVTREMTDPQGGFYSTQDADSEGEEGRYFVWDREEVHALLGQEEGRLFCRYYDVRQEGNFEHGKSILNIPVEAPELARFLDVDPERLDDAARRGREALARARENRTRPERDEKIQASWNGLMISAFARAHQVLGRPEYLESAHNAAAFILGRMRTESGRLLHTYNAGRARFPGYQDDYAFLTNGLLDLYEASFDPRWLNAAETLTETMLREFWDPEQGGFFFTGRSNERLIVRSKNPYDNAIPSGNSMAVTSLMRLGTILDRPDLWKKAEQTLKLFEPMLREMPSGFGQMLCGLDTFTRRPVEIVLVGEPEDSTMKDLLKTAYGLPPSSRVIILADPDGREDLARRIPLLSDKTAVNGKPTAYVCRDSVCSAPVTADTQLRALLLNSS